jgi:hypothetical protein
MTAPLRNEDFEGVVNFEIGLAKHCVAARSSRYQYDQLPVAIT